MPENETLKYTHDTFTKDKIGKMVLIELTNGTMVKGKLLEVGKFDISMEVHPDIGIEGFGTGMDITKWISIIVLKSAIAIIWVISNGRNL